MDKMDKMRTADNLPAYAPVDVAADAAEDANISAAFAHFKISANTAAMDPTPELCLAHLKLLHVFDRLKRDIQGHDGLFGIYDARLAHSESLKDIDSKHENVRTKLRQKELTDLREKRWTLYVARAVHRYEQWWRLLPGEDMTERQKRGMKENWYETWRMSTLGLGKKHKASQDQVTTITGDCIPPIDVIMVWHTHFLNPRHYLNDCLRLGKLYLWEGFPWAAVDECIDGDLEFYPTASAVTSWTNLTSQPWTNEDGRDEVTLACISCDTPYEHPWTTAGAPEDATL